MLPVVKWYPPDEEIGELPALNVEGGRDGTMVRDIFFDALKESLGLTGKDVQDMRVPADDVFQRPLRGGLRVGAATKSSNLDVVHIEMLEPQPKAIEGLPPRTKEGDKEHLELHQKRGEEVSRIRRSMAALKVARKSNKVMMEPVHDAKDEKSPSSEAKYVSSFSREELYLLRQVLAVITFPHSTQCPSCALSWKAFSDILCASLQCE